MGIRRFCVSVVAAGCVAAIGPAGAAATVTTNPTSLDFGNQAIGSTSSPQPVTLTVPCTGVVTPPMGTPICITNAFDGFNASPAADNDFAATSDCPASMGPSPTGAAQTCTISVTFTPNALGDATGTLTTGTLAIAPVPGPTVSLTGTGVVPPPPPPVSGGSGGSTGPGAPAGGVQGAVRKCKKKAKRGAAAAKKKCGKKKGK